MKSFEKIVQTLIINGTLIDQPGLFYGKIGIAVFFFHYARLTGNTLFQDYAIDLIDEVQKQITVTISARYDTGMAGIGVGFEYFLQNGFLGADDSDIFEDFDARMYRATMYEPYPDLSLEGGLTGWGRYFIYRLNGNMKKNKIIHKALTHIAKEITQKIVKNMVPEIEKPDVYRFFYDLNKTHEYADKYRTTLQHCNNWESICNPDEQKIFPYMNNLHRLYVCQNYFNVHLTEKIGLEWKKWEESDNNSLTDMGLLKGWVTEGLLYLTFSEKQDTSWINLL